MVRDSNWREIGGVCLCGRDDVRADVLEIFEFSAHCGFHLHVHPPSSILSILLSVSNFRSSFSFYIFISQISYFISVKHTKTSRKLLASGDTNLTVSQFKRLRKQVNHSQHPNNHIHAKYYDNHNRFNNISTPLCNISVSIYC